MSSWLHYQELLLIKMSHIYNLSSYSQSFPTNSVVISSFAEKVTNQQNAITGRSHCYHLFETFALTSSSLIDFPKNQLTPGSRQKPADRWDRIKKSPSFLEGRRYLLGRSFVGDSCQNASSSSWHIPTQRQQCRLVYGQHCEPSFVRPPA